MFRRAWEMGLFGEKKVELIYGEIIEKRPMKPPHATFVQFLQGALIQLFGSGHVVRIQMPFIAADESEPEPDVAVVTGSPIDFLHEHPTQAVLLVEVADATLAYDLGTKSRLYAQSGVPEYWVADVRAGLLHVHRQPLASPSFEGGYGYQNVSHLTRTDRVTPLSSSTSLLVGDILPPL